VKRYLQARFAAWVKRRQGADVLPVTIHRRRLYILPTRAGVAFSALLLVMLIAGLNYSNSLALLLTFMLGGFAVVVMHQCHRNLLGVTLNGAAPPACFAGETARLPLVLANSAKLTRHQIEGSLPGGERYAADLPGHSVRNLEVLVRTAKRGVLRIERVRISTSYPFGLFRAWAWVHLPIDVTVYPRPKGALPMPQDSGTRAGQRSRLATGTEEWLGLRDFRDGDSPRQVAWKAYARGAPLLVKEYSSAGTDQRLFDFAALGSLELESRLEQLARWVVDAEAREERYALVTPDARVGPDHGPEHRHRCLSVLAKHGLAPIAPPNAQRAGRSGAPIAK
jgi:uncharacterized protein (DUF58 family)